MTEVLTSGFVWVVRASDRSNSDLAYMTQGFDGRTTVFQNPYTVGDKEGLYVEYYDDVIYWRDLEYPSSKLSEGWNQV